MAENPKLLEEAHFRVDEHERRLNQFETVIGVPVLKRERTPSQDPVEDVHLRVDEQERRIKAIEQMFAPENLALLVPMILKAMGEEAQADQHMSERLDALTGKLEALVSALLTPTTRIATLELPSGLAHMTVRETRQ